MMRKQVHKEGSRVGSSADHWLAVGHAGSRVIQVVVIQALVIQLITPVSLVKHKAFILLFFI